MHVLTSLMGPGLRRRIVPLLLVYLASWGLIAPPNLAPQVWAVGSMATGQPAPGAEPTSSTELRDAARQVAAMGRAAQQALATIPRTTFDPQAVVAHVGEDVDALRTWVTQRTAWVPYRGILRGARGTLLDRQGSHLDRAVLLATLLEEAGSEVRLAQRQLDDGEIDVLLEGLTKGAPPAPETSELGPGGTMPVAEAGPAAGRRILEAQNLLERAMSRVVTQAQQLAEVAGIDESSVGDDAAAEAARRAAAADYWWVQLREDDSWRDLHTFSEAATSAIVDAEPTTAVALADLDDSHYHTVTISIVVERLEAGDGGPSAVRETALQFPVRSADTIGRHIALSFYAPGRADPGATGCSGRPLRSRQRGGPHDPWGHRSPREDGGVAAHDRL